MKINRAEIIGFGKLSNKTYTFKNGLNLIYGENEKGKSTLHKFIEGVLFGFYKPYTKNKQYTEDYDNYLPWEGEHYSGSIEFTINTKRYRAYRNFLKAKEEFKLFDAVTGEDITSILPYDSVKKQHSIDELIKMTSILYNNTASIGQLKAKTEDGFKKEISETLSNYEKGADSSVSLSKATEIIESERQQIGTKRQSKSPLGSSVAALEELMARKEKIISIEEENKNNYIKVKTLGDEINELQKERKNLESRVNNIAFNDEKEKYLQYKAVANENKELREKLFSLNKYKGMKNEDYKEFIDLENKLNNTKDDLETVKDELGIQNTVKDKLKRETYKMSEELGGKKYEKFKADAEVLDDRIATIKKLKKALDNQKDDTIEKDFNQKDNMNKIVNIFLLLGVIATLFLVVFSFRVNETFLMYAYVAGGVTIAFVIMKLVVYSVLKNKSSEYEKYDTTILRTKNMIELNEVDINRLLEEYDEKDIEKLRIKIKDKCDISREFREKSDEYNRILIQIEEASEKEKRLTENEEKYSKEISELLAEKNMTDADEFKNAIEGKQEYELLSAKLEDNTKLMNSIVAHEEVPELEEKFSVPLVEEPEEVGETAFFGKEELGSKIRELSLKISAKREEFSRMAGIIEKATEENEDLSVIEEEINKYNNKISDYEYRLAVTQKAIDTINRISKDIHANVAPSINETIGEIIKLVSGGKYSRIAVDNNMDIKVLDESSGKMVSAEKLSNGTIDQIYMALRMSITNNLLANDDIPILLDETFIQYDDERLARMMEYVANMANKRQILMFTCHGREENVLKNKGINYDKIFL